MQHTRRIEKVLEDANIKLSSKALIAGESNAVALAALAVSRLKCSRAELKEALEGRIYATIASWLVSICG